MIVLKAIMLKIVARPVSLANPGMARHNLSREGNKVETLCREPVDPEIQIPLKRKA